MIQKYGDEYTKALSVMISRGDFNINLNINDLDTYLKYVDLNKTMSINSIEIDMLTGKSKDTNIIKYYSDKETISMHEITGLDLLLYSSIDNEDIFNKLINQEDCDFTKVSYTLNEVLNRKKMQKAELLLKKGSTLNSLFTNSKITIAELQLLDIISGLTLKKDVNKTNIIDKLDFILNYREYIDTSSFLVIDTVLNNSINFIRDYYIEDLELKHKDILSKVKEFAEIVIEI